MGYPTSDNFSRHSQNFAEIRASLVQLERVHKRAIREGDDAAVKTLRKIHYLLVGVFAEAGLRKIIEDPTGFNDRERRLIWGERRQEDRWRATVEFAARRHYAVLAHQDLADILPPSDLLRLERVQRLLAGELASTITDRNRLAHGQWKWQLKSGRDDSFAQTSTTFDYNFIQTKARSELITAISELVHVLVVSRPAFDRDFAAIDQRIRRYERDLSGASYGDFVRELQRKRRPLVIP